MSLEIVTRDINYIKNDIDSLKFNFATLKSGIENSILSTISTELKTIKDDIRTLKGASSSNTSLNVEMTVPCSESTTSRSETTEAQLSSIPLTSIAWNCRGLGNAVPYIQELSLQNDIIIISEHWLWPYELSGLDTILDGNTSIGCSDKRLNDQCTLCRGCGGVAILWRNHLHVTPVSNISTDRFQAIQIPYLNTQVLSIVGVYLPSSDHPVQEYVDCLAELESVISALQADGPVIIMGDFNAHLGNVDNSGTHNQVGELLFDVVCRCNLYVASISGMATGANYTYSNGPHHTTVDY